MTARYRRVPTLRRPQATPRAENIDGRARIVSSIDRMNRCAAPALSPAEATSGGLSRPRQTCRIQRGQARGGLVFDEVFEPSVRAARLALESRAGVDRVGPRPESFGLFAANGCGAWDPSPRPGQEQLFLSLFLTPLRQPTTLAGVTASVPALSGAKKKTPGRRSRLRAQLDLSISTTIWNRRMGQRRRGVRNNLFAVVPNSVPRGGLRPDEATECPSQSHCQTTKF